MRIVFVKKSLSIRLFAVTPQKTVDVRPYRIPLFVMVTFGYLSLPLPTHLRFACKWIQLKKETRHGDSFCKSSFK